MLIIIVTLLIKLYENVFIGIPLKELFRMTENFRAFTLCFVKKFGAEFFRREKCPVVTEGKLSRIFIYAFHRFNLCVSIRTVYKRGIFFSEENPRFSPKKMSFQRLKRAKQPLKELIHKFLYKISSIMAEQYCKEFS